MKVNLALAAAALMLAGCGAVANQLETYTPQVSMTLHISGAGYLVIPQMKAATETVPPVGASEMIVNGKEVAIQCESSDQSCSSPMTVSVNSGDIVQVEIGARAN